MAITYTWKVSSLKTKSENGFDNAVVQTYWTKTGTDEDGNTGVFTGATPFPMANIDPDNFIEFESLTEETVLDWIKGVVVGSYEQHVNDQILKQINSKKAPVEEKPLPWAPVPAAPVANTN